MREGRHNLLKERLWRDGGVHELAEDDIGLLSDRLSRVAQPVHDRGEDRVKVGTEVAGQAVDQEPDNVQAVLGDLPNKYVGFR